MFNCKFAQMDVTSANIKIWENKLRTMTHLIPKIMLKRYGVNNIDEYKSLIKSNIDNQENLNKIKEVYDNNLKIAQKLAAEEQKVIIAKLVKESIKRANESVKLQMLTKRNYKKAKKLYIDFKTIMEENTEDANINIADFIIKNTIFGLFVDKELAGIIIIDKNKKFRIDNQPEKVETFYIQEMIIDHKYTGRGYGNLLINYAILRCPPEIKYISYMTMPSNKPMIAIGKKFNFILQERPSGDPKHSLLFIRENDKVERELHKNLSYISLKASSSSRLLSSSSFGSASSSR